MTTNQQTNTPTPFFFHLNCLFFYIPIEASLSCLYIVFNLILIKIIYDDG